MSIRRKSTAHDLATLRLHPDGSRVQQSATNARRRTAGYTVIDSRGNWIAKDAGGKASVKKRRRISVPHTSDTDCEFIDLSGDDHSKATRSQSKGKQRARDSENLDDPSESERLNTRTRQRLSFIRDLSFLDPPPISVSSLDRGADYSDLTSACKPMCSFSDPASDLLKSIHHFASCYYRERGQLLDSSRDYRGIKKERCIKSRNSIHTFAAKTVGRRSTNSEIDLMDTEGETTEDEGEESEVMDIEDSGKEGGRKKGDTYKKDMYKAFDGSALMAIGIVLQEYVAHTLLSTSCVPQEPVAESSKRRGAGE